MSNSFYKAFEDKFRGDRSDIKDRLNVYLPFIVPLLEYYPDAVAIDLGCGRGEWLELLNENEVLAKGVDIDKEMLSDCKKRNFDVYEQDAMEFLKVQPDASAIVISGFHIVEHIPFTYLQELTKEAKRVLKPGGILIFETPNSENLEVGTSSFYLDPTHDKPIPPNLLDFVTEYEGFERSKILRLQESSNLRDKDKLNIEDVIAGASPDYSVVAQKKAPLEIMQSVNLAFEQSYGFSLRDLTNKYVVDQEQSETEMKAEIRSIKGSTSEINTQLSEINTQLKVTNEKFTEYKRSLLDELEKTRSELYEANQHIDAMYKSKSWLISAPLRYVGSLIRAMFSFLRLIAVTIVRYLIIFFEKPISLLIRWVIRKPKLKVLVLAVIQRFPGLSHQLRGVVNRYGVAENRVPSANSSKYELAEVDNRLSSRAQKNYLELKKAIEQYKKESE